MKKMNESTNMGFAPINETILLKSKFTNLKLKILDSEQSTQGVGLTVVFGNGIKKPIFEFVESINETTISLIRRTIWNLRNGDYDKAPAPLRSDYVALTKLLWDMFIKNGVELDSFTIKYLKTKSL